MATQFSVEGIVQKGKNRGKNLGFPTINLYVDREIPEGIYISQTKVKDKTYNSLTFIGAAKTYDEVNFQAETYIFDFDEDIYGEHVKVNLLEKIRENIKFESEEELIEQMKKDKEEAIRYFSEH